MGMEMCLRKVIWSVLLIGFVVFGAIERSWAQNDGVTRTWTFLPTAAATLEKSKPKDRQTGDLVVAGGSENSRAVATKQVYLNFDLSTVPKDACITSWT